MELRAVHQLKFSFVACAYKYHVKIRRRQLAGYGKGGPVTGMAISSGRTGGEQARGEGVESYAAESQNTVFIIQEEKRRISCYAPHEKAVTILTLHIMYAMRDAFPPL